MLYAILCYDSEDVVGSWSKEKDAAVMASLGAVQSEYRGLQLSLVNSRHHHVQRPAISGFQFQAVHRGLLNGRNAERERRRRRGGRKSAG